MHNDDCLAIASVPQFNIMCRADRHFVKGRRYTYPRYACGRLSPRLTMAAMHQGQQHACGEKRTSDDAPNEQREA